MLQQIEALLALNQHQTMQNAALALHITQSAVSKRVAELERRLAKPLISRQGRRVVLTLEGLRLVEGARTLVEQLNLLIGSTSTLKSGKVIIELSGSVLISWGAKALAQAAKEIDGLILEVKTTHASLAVQNVQSGVSMVAIAQGESTIAPDLTSLPLYKQQLVIVPSGLRKFELPRKGALEVLAIESHTEAWHFTKQALTNTTNSWKFNIKVIQELQSFSAVAQMARFGFGHGLVPEDVALTLGIPKRKLVHLPAPGIYIPVSFIGRHSSFALPQVSALYKKLRTIK